MTHAFHKNIVREVSSWPGGKLYIPKPGEPERVLDDSTFRDFKDEIHMTEVMAETINKYVQPGDRLYHLGDWSFGGKDKIVRFREMINCKEIHLVFGNHDQNIMKYYRHLFTSTQHYIQKSFGHKPNRFPVCMFHYAQRIWDKSHHGAIQLHGHSHDGLETRFIDHPVNTYYNQYRTMDVGVDGAFRRFGEYRPYNVIDEIIPMMQDRLILKIDHHSTETN